MASLIQSLRRRPEAQDGAQRSQALSFGDWAQSFGFGGLGYQFIQGPSAGGREEFGADFRGYVEGAYKSNGVVFACILSRMLLFSEARFQFRQIRSGRPGDLFGSQALRPLESPWPNGTTGDLLGRMLQDADLAGNAYVARRPNGRLKRLRPDWVTIVMGSPVRPDVDADISDLDVEVIGYVYHPRGPNHSGDGIVLMPNEVAHFAPIPDPSAAFRGMSWLSPVVREIMADGAATDHKLKFFENGATPNMVVTYDKDIQQSAADEVREKIRQRLGGPHNAYETMILGAGAHVDIVGADMKQLDFKVTQGHGETRIAAAAGVPPIIVGLSEGLEAATYANYGQAKRRFADGTMRPLWRNAAGSLASIIDVPAGSELWYDDRDVPFLQEDIKDSAEIQSIEAQTLRTLIEAGYTPESAQECVIAGDYKRLKHTGLYSVQLQEPGTQEPSAPAAPAAVPAVNGANGRRLLEQFVSART